MRPAGWKLFGHAMFELSQLNVTEVAKFVQRNFQNLFTKAAPPGKQIQNFFLLGASPSVRDCRLIRRPVKDACRKREPCLGRLPGRAFAHQKMALESNAATA